MKIEASSDLITVKGRGLDLLVEALDQNALEILNETPDNKAGTVETPIYISSINVGQSLVGQTFCIEADSQPGVEAIIKKKKLRMEQPGQICAFDFFGTKILLCPVNYVFTDVELIAVKSLDNNRVELTFEGGLRSLWRIGYNRSNRGIP